MMTSLRTTRKKTIKNNIHIGGDNIGWKKSMRRGIKDATFDTYRTKHKWYYVSFAKVIPLIDGAKKKEKLNELVDIINTRLHKELNLDIIKVPNKYHKEIQKVTRDFIIAQQINFAAIENFDKLKEYFNKIPTSELQKYYGKFIPKRNQVPYSATLH